MDEKEKTASEEAVPEKILSDELAGKPITDYLPAYKHRPNFNHSKVAEEVLKVILAQHPSMEDMELVFAIARYKVANKLILTTETF